MTFVLSKIVWFLVQPLNLIVLLVLAGPVLSALRLRRVGQFAFQTGLVILIVVSILPIGQMLLIPLENRFARPATMPKEITGLIVLGGGALSDLSVARGTVSLSNAAERYTEAVYLARLYPNARVVFTGGSSDVLGPGFSEADTVRTLFAELGLTGPRVLFERSSRNTWENAVNTQALIKPKAGERWLLVTSANHMPRSVGIFRRVGWTVIPYPVDYRTLGYVDIRGFDFLDRMDEFDTAIKEWIGLISYRFLGRTDALLPGPV